MKAVNTERGLCVTLSRRNLLALLHKLDMEGSARTLFKHTAAGLVVVQSEDDAAHYGEVVPGEMHSETEAFIEGQSQK